MTDTENEFTLDPIVPESAPVAATAPGPDVLMIRNPRQGGKGVFKMLVPAAQVADFKAAGWSEAK